ncbi:MAG: hypothetical protein KA419_00630 [Acidobacteria bacterium]|nr:hypothetical protein [Acidobacteriota bacterium]
MTNVQKTARRALALLALLALAAPALAQDEASRLAIRKAMKDELQRNREQLALPGLQKPFQIVYRLRDIDTTVIRASLGALVQSQSQHRRDHRVDVLVGDYFRNNLNFFEMTGGMVGRMVMRGGGGGAEIPIENDVSVIRTALWSSTDEAYKEAAEEFERKMSAVSQQKLTEEMAALPDLSRAEPVTRVEPPRRFSVDKPHWEKVVRELSGALRKYPDVQASSVCACFIQTDASLLSTEGIETVVPVTLAVVKADFSTQSDDGTPLRDYVCFLGPTPADLPSPDSMKASLEQGVARFCELRTAPLFDGSYSGPVLFEAEAVGELFGQRLFSASAPGLIAARKPVCDNPQAARMVEMMSGKSLEDKLDTRVLPKEFSIVAVPGLPSFGDVRLVGTFSVDAEGVVPAEKLTLVEGGILKNLLNGLIPTPKCPKSTGHSRLVINPMAPAEAVGPGVVSVETTGTAPKDGLKAELLRLAKEAGSKQAYIVRKLANPAMESKDLQGLVAGLMMRMGSEAGEDRIGEPVYVYRVDVETGKEEPVRGCTLAGVPVSALRRIAGADAERLAYNTLVPASAGDSAASGILSLFGGGGGGGGWRPSGIPASFIVPRGLLFEELDLKKESRTATPRLPVVASPLQ